MKKKVCFLFMIVLMGFITKGYNQGICCIRTPNANPACVRLNLSGDAARAQCRNERPDINGAERMFIGDEQNIKEDKSCENPTACLFANCCTSDVSWLCSPTELLDKKYCEEITKGRYYGTAISCAVNPCAGPPPASINLFATYSSSYSPQSNSVEIKWGNVGEKNYDFYIIRSRDGKNYKTIGKVGYNNSSTVADMYNFVDVYPYEDGYYRVQWITTTDGILHESQTFHVIATKSGKLIVKPNPATENVNLLLQNMQLYNTDVSIYDLSGRKVLRQRLSQGQTELDLSTLAKGTFIIRANQNGKTYTEKLIRN